MSEMDRPARTDSLAPASGPGGMARGFTRGIVVITPGAGEVLDKHPLPSPIVALAIIVRHCSGDWGEVDAEDARANERALRDGARLMSGYTVAGSKLWVITEADRSTTTILTPDEY